MTACTQTRTNPLLEDWTTPYGVPPFDKIQTADYLPAIDSGIAQQRAEIRAIRAAIDEECRARDELRVLAPADGLIHRALLVATLCELIGMERVADARRLEEIEGQELLVGSFIIFNSIIPQEKPAINSLCFPD